MQSHATAPSSPRLHLFSGGGDGDFEEDGGEGGGGGNGHYFFFSAPASPVHYILRSPPSSTAATVSQYAPTTDGDCCGGAGDFEFAGAGAAMSSAEELFLAGRIRVGCLSPIIQETAYGEQEDGEEEGGVDGHAQRPCRTRSASPPRSLRLAKSAEPSDSSASASSSSSAVSSSSVKSTLRRISLRDLLSGSANDSAAAQAAAGGERSGLWPPSIWPSRSKKALPYPPPQPGRRSTSSDWAGPKRAPEAPRRRTTSLPYRQGLVLGCLGFGARSYGLAKSMNPLSSR